MYVTWLSNGLSSGEFYIARAAGAQEIQQLELRQRGGDRAVQRVRAEIPATCMVRPAVQ
jgi:hypothetical protein